MLEQFGKVFMPDKASIRGFVVFFPPAIGDNGQQHDEAELYKTRAIGSLLYRAPYLNPEARNDAKFWNHARADLNAIANLIDSTLPHGNNSWAIIGKNLGGSAAAHSISLPPTCLIVTGSVPVLSKLGSQAYLPEFDLVRTLPALNIPTLVQFGTKDEWIKSEDVSALQSKISVLHQIEWIDSDHEMSAPLALERRLAFLEKYFN